VFINKKKKIILKFHVFYLLNNNYLKHQTNILIFIYLIVYIYFEIIIFLITNYYFNFLKLYLQIKFVKI